MLGHQNKDKCYNNRIQIKKMDGSEKITGLESKKLLIALAMVNEFQKISRPEYSHLVLRESEKPRPLNKLIVYNEN